MTANGIGIDDIVAKMVPGAACSIRDIDRGS
jgi:hypothetical protein